MCGRVKFVMYFGSPERYTWPRMIWGIMSLDSLLTASPSGMFGAELWAGLARALSADSGFIRHKGRPCLEPVLN